jgi:hypothetical protein
VTLRVAAVHRLWHLLVIHKMRHRALIRCSPRLQVRHLRSRGDAAVHLANQPGSAGQAAGLVPSLQHAMQVRPMAISNARCSCRGVTHNALLPSFGCFCWSCFVHSAVH